MAALPTTARCPTRPRRATRVATRAKRADPWPMSRSLPHP
jgi:hypothetical protein